MEKSAPVLAERPVVKEVNNAGNPLPTTSVAAEHNAGEVISTELKKLGHKPETVLVNGPAQTILAEVQKQGIGKVVGDVGQEARDLSDLLIRAAENLGRSVGDSQNDIYTTPASSGHEGVKGRITRIDKFKRSEDKKVA